jgi:hypothetical protein
VKGLNLKMTITFTVEAGEMMLCITGQKKMRVPVQDHRKLMAGSCTISYVCVLFKSNNSSHKKMQNTHMLSNGLTKITQSEICTRDRETTYFATNL